MKSRLVLLACCLALLSSCGQGDKGTGKAPEFAVIEAKTTTANLTNSYPATIKGKQDVEIRHALVPSFRLIIDIPRL